MCQLKNAFMTGCYLGIPMYGATLAKTVSVQFGIHT